MNSDEDLSNVEVHELIDSLENTINQLSDDEDNDCMEYSKIANSEVAKVEDIIMKVELWKEFPSELHAQVLRYCSVPELCRLQIVCRKWNLFHKLEFAFRAQPEETYILRGLHEIDVGDMDANNEEIIKDLLRNNLDLFDPSTQKSYLISLEYLYDSMQSSSPCLDHFEIMDFQIMAAEKGFVWVLYSTVSRLKLVTNPITRLVIVIPPIPFFANTKFVYVTGVITVAKNYSSFELYVVFAIRGLRRRDIVWFDSKVGKWQESSQPPWTLTPCDMLKMKEMLYMLLWDRSNDIYQLFAFDMALDTWTNMGVTLPNNRVPQLTMILGRLFFVGFVEDDNYEANTIEVVEIDVTSGECSIVTTIEKPNRGEMWRFGEYSMEDLGWCQGMGSNTKVVGCGNFIVLTSITGKFITHDLLNDDLSEWSYRWSIANPNDKNELRYGLFGMATTLTLNPLSVPRVQQP